MLSGKLQKDELGYVLLNLKTGLPSGSELAYGLVCSQLLELIQPRIPIFARSSLSQGDPAAVEIDYASNH